MNILYGAAFVFGLLLLFFKGIKKNWNNEETCDKHYKNKE